VVRQLVTDGSLTRKTDKVESITFVVSNKILSLFILILNL